MKKIPSFAISFVLLIFVGILFMRCSPDAIKKGYRKALKDNYAFQIASSHDGSKVALSGFNKDTSSNFALFFAENDFNFTKINFPENIVYGGG